MLRARRRTCRSRLRSRCNLSIVRGRTLALLLVSLTVSVLAGPAKEEFVGHWRYIGEHQTCDYTFKDDGTFSGQMVEDGKIVLEFSGKWSIDGDKLKYEYTRVSPEVITPGTVDQDRIAEVTPEYYIVETRYYSRRQYSRVD